MVRILANEDRQHVMASHTGHATHHAAHHTAIAMHHHHTAADGVHHHHFHHTANRQVMAPEWIKYTAACNEAAKKIVYPGTFYTLRKLMWALILADLALYITVLTTAAWTIPHNSRLADRVHRQLYGNLFSTSNGDSVSIGVYGVETCGEDATVTILCRYSIATSSVRRTAFGPAFSATVAMFAIGFATCGLSFFLSLFTSWPLNVCQQGAEGFNDPWKVKWGQRLCWLASLSGVCALVGTLLMGLAVPHRFEDEFSGSMKRGDMRLGPGLCCAIAVIFVSTALALLALRFAITMRAHARTTALPQLPPPPTGPRYVDLFTALTLLQQSAPSPSLGIDRKETLDTAAVNIHIPVATAPPMPAKITPIENPSHVSVPQAPSANLEPTNEPFSAVSAAIAPTQAAHTATAPAATEGKDGDEGEGEEGGERGEPQCYHPSPLLAAVDTEAAQDSDDKLGPVV